MSLNLIDHALQYAQEARIAVQNQMGFITVPLFPEAQRSAFYLKVRESINTGCKKAVAAIPENWKRSVAYSILMEACYDIFHFGYDIRLVNLYNSRLDAIIGLH
jgi:hypothetical protein